MDIQVFVFRSSSINTTEKSKNTQSFDMFNMCIKAVYIQACTMKRSLYCSSPLTLMESILAEGKVAINLFCVQTSDGDILGGSAGGVGGKTGIWGNRVSCTRGLYVGQGNEVHGFGWMVGCEAVVMAG